MGVRNVRPEISRNLSKPYFIIWPSREHLFVASSNAHRTGLEWAFLLVVLLSDRNVQPKVWNLPSLLFLVPDLVLLQIAKRVFAVIRQAVDEIRCRWLVSV